MGVSFGLAEQGGQWEEVVLGEEGGWEGKEEEAEREGAVSGGDGEQTQEGGGGEQGEEGDVGVDVPRL